MYPDAVVGVGSCFLEFVMGVDIYGIVVVIGSFQVCILDDVWTILAQPCADVGFHFGFASVTKLEDIVPSL